MKVEKLSYVHIHIYMYLGSSVPYACLILLYYPEAVDVVNLYLYTYVHVEIFIYICQNVYKKIFNVNLYEFMHVYMGVLDFFFFSIF